MKQKHTHVHVNCPTCKGNTFEILIYRDKTVIRCPLDKTSLDLEPKIVDEFLKKLDEDN